MRLCAKTNILFNRHNYQIVFFSLGFVGGCWAAIKIYYYNHWA